MAGVIHQDANWLNVSQGKFVNKKNNISLDGWEGRITSIKKREGDYNGEPKVDVILGMSDGVESVLISFNAESPYARGFFARIESIDLSKPFQLGALPWDDDGKRDKAVSLCYMKQFGQKVEPDRSFPNSESVKVGSRTVADWSKMNARTDAIVAALSAKLAPVTQATEEPVDAEEPTPVDDLPF